MFSFNSKNTQLGMSGIELGNARKLTREIEAKATLKRAKTFAFEWLRQPLKVGAISPSSSHLAAAMTKDIDSVYCRVLELGPGTGVFTEAIIAKGIQPSEITTIELGSRFAQIMRERFPEIRVLQGDAARITHQLSNEGLIVDHVVCGLPLLSMTDESVVQILEGSFKLIAPEGRFHLFTYGWKCPVRKHVMQHLNLIASKTASTLRNLPPASVYELKKANC